MNTSWNVDANNTDKSNLYELFQLPCVPVPTSGTQLGMILRFRTFYLKIYDTDEYEDVYNIKGFRYNETNPVFEENVPGFRMREFASQFTQEDYLLRFQEPCDDPNCFLLKYNT